MAIHIDDKFFQLLEHAGTVKLYKAGMPIFVQEEKAENIYIVESGRVRAGTITKEGHEITFEILNKGRIFGDASFLSQSHRTANITAVTDARIILCKASDMIPLLMQERQLLVTMLQHLTDTCNLLSHQIIRNTTYSAKEKVADLLLELSTSYKGDIPFTHEDIAHSLALNRVTVSRILSTLKNEGIIDYSYGIITILDKKKLKEILQQ